MIACDHRAHVFILGSARSGTSLLASILQNSPGFASYHAETKLLRDCEHKYGRLDKQKNRQLFLKDWLNSRQYKRSGLSEEEARALLANNCSYIGFLSAYMNQVANNQGCDRWIDSTPDNLYVLDSIIQAFPNAKIIHMLRDGRSVALSLAKLGWSGVRTNNFDTALLYAALKWQAAVGHVRNLSARINDRYLEVRYEDFVTNPETKIAEVCTFLDIPRIESSLLKTDASHNLYSALHTPNTPFADLAAGISSNAIARWKTLLSAEQIRSVEAYISTTLMSMGYETVNVIPISIIEQMTKTLRQWHLDSMHNLKANTLLGRYSASPLEIGMD